MSSSLSIFRQTLSGSKANYVCVHDLKEAIEQSLASGLVPSKELIAALSLGMFEVHHVEPGNAFFGQCVSPLAFEGRPVLS